MSHSEYILGTRGSALALTQSRLAAESVTELYAKHQPGGEPAESVSFELRTVKTEGDVLTGPLATLGGTGVFAAALRQRLLDGADAPAEQRVDMAVHSLKDLPSAPCPGLVIAATLKREDPRDALVARDGLTLDTLPTGSRVGTGSPRRAAQLRALRPDLEIVDIRGNVGTRIGRVKGLEEHSGKQVVLRQNAETDEHADRGVGTERLGDCDAVVLAVSGLKRLGKEHLITEYLDPSRMLPAPGQGALALEVRESEFGNPDPAVLDDADAASRHRIGGALDVSGSIHHFLLPAKGWGSAVEVPKQVRDLVDAGRFKALKTWRRDITKALSATQALRLTALARRVEVLWEMTLRRLRVAEAEASRRINLWGREAQDEAGSTVSREEIEEYLAAPGSAYRRLRLVMDAWCALWFWPLTTDVTPPSLDEWLDALEGLLGKQVKDAKGTDGTLVDASSWAELETMEEVELGLAGARKVQSVVDEHEWLAVVREVAEAQGFFHWELDFATVFARGGFDLQVGNPPWVRPRTDVASLLSEGDPWWTLSSKPSVAAKNERMPLTLARARVLHMVLDGTAEVVVLSELLSDPSVYPPLSGQPDLYRAFMCQVWEHQSGHGISSLIHMDTHFTDTKTPELRTLTYEHLRRHWRFINELRLFDIEDHKHYGVHVYGAPRPPQFLHAVALYHPDTVVRSLLHDGSGEEPGFKDPHTGTWDLRPHASRIESIDESALKVWQSVTESDDWHSAPMVSTANSAASRTLATLATQPRISTLSLQFSSGWHETSDFEKGRFEKAWGPASWDDVIIQGPHLHVSTPLYKQPNESMKHNQDWTSTDLETLSASAEPVTQYKPAGDRATYDRLYTHWDSSPARDHYRIAWRAMAANTGERTLIPAIIPPGTAHPNGVFSSGSATITGRSLVAAQASLSSLLADFTLRALPKSGIYFPDFSRLPALPHNHPLTTHVVLRTLRLNCVTDTYADLWTECWDESFVTDTPILERHDERPIGPEWTADTPLRRAEDRRNAQAEIDVMVAMMLGVPIEDLCTIYRTQFAVLYDYDHGRGQGAYVYDANGRQLPTPVRQAWEKRQRPTSNEDMPLSERTHTHPGSGVSYVYDLPFRIRDRESDFRRIHTALTTNRTSITTCTGTPTEGHRPNDT